MANTADYTRRAIDKYRAKFDIIQIKAPKGTKERITTLSGQSMAAFCLQCVLDRLDELERSQPDTLPEEPETEVPAADQPRQAVTDEEVLEIWRKRVAENEAKKKAAANEMPPEPEPVQEEEPEDAKAVFLRELERIRAGQMPEENPEKEAARTASKKQEESEEK